MASATRTRNIEAYLADLSRRLGSGRTLKVGFLSGATYPDGTPVALVAAVQNFGAPSRGIPPRPFLDQVKAAHENEWPVQLAKLIEAGDDPVTALGKMGEIMKGQIQQSIRDTDSPPLKPATVRRKGFDKPLIDTGHMLNSVDYAVEER